MVEDLASYSSQSFSNTTDNDHTMVVVTRTPVVRVLDVKDCREPEDDAWSREDF